MLPYMYMQQPTVLYPQCTMWEENPVTCINDLCVTAQQMELKPLQLLPRWTHNTLDQAHLALHKWYRK